MTSNDPTPRYCADLVRRIAEDRDRDAFSEIFDLFAGRLKAYYLRLGTSPADAEELTRLHCADVEDTQVGVTRIGNLMSIRILAYETWQAHEAIFKAWTALRPAIAGKAARPILKC